jgi:hypothetical protein
MRQASRHARHLIALAGALTGTLTGALAVATPAAAQPDAERGAIKTKVSIIEETIFTSNALGTDTHLPDRIHRLRGALDVSGGADDLSFEIKAAAEADEYRRYDFESDRRATIGVLVSRNWGDRLTLRGTVNGALEDRGDHLDLGAAIIGFRTHAHTLAGELSAVLRLTDTLSATASLSRSSETVGKARFVIDLDDLKLAPDNRRQVAAFGLSHKTAGSEYAVIARIGDLRATGDDPFPAILASQRQSVALRAQTTTQHGTRLAGEIGIERLRDSLGILDAVYPIYELVAERTLKGGTTLKLNLKGFVDTVDSDDPFASYAHRGEIELTHPLPLRFSASAGLFAEQRENIAIGNDETAWGAYGAIGYSHNERLSFLLRLDYDERRRSLVGTHHHTLAARLGAQMQL